MKTTKRDLFDLLKDVEEKNQKIAEVFEDHSYLDETIDIIWWLILDKLGISQNEDKALDVLCDFGEGNIKKEETIKRLNKLSNLKSK